MKPISTPLLSQKNLWLDWTETLGENPNSSLEMLFWYIELA